MASIDVSTQLESLLRLQQDLARESNIDRILARIVETAAGMLAAEDEEFAVAHASAAGIALDYVQLCDELAAERLRLPA